MKRLAKFVTTAGVMASICLGCTGQASSSDERPNRQSLKALASAPPSFSDIYAARQGRPAPPSALDTQGAWIGVLYCPSGAYPIEMNVAEDGAATASILPALGKPAQKTPFYKEFSDKPGQIEALPAVRAIRFLAPKEGTEADQRGLAIDVLLDPQNLERGHVVATELSGQRRPRECTQGIIGKGAAAADISRLQRTTVTLAEDRRPVVQTDCPAKYAQWLDQSPDAQRALTDEFFVPVFGKPFPEMDAEPLMEAASVVMGSCVTTDNKPLNLKVRRTGSALKNARWFQSAFVADWTDPLVANWTAWMKAEIDRGITDFSQSMTPAAIPIRFSLRTHKGFEGYAEWIASKLEAASTEASLLNVLTRMDEAKDNFRNLNDIYLAAQARGDVDINIVREGMSHYLPYAAGKFARDAATRNDAIYMASWADQYAGEAGCSMATDMACGVAGRLFDTKLSSLAAGFAEEQDALASAIDEKDRLARLATLVEFENNLDRTYGPLSTHDAFAPGKQARAAQREKLQKQSKGKIAKKIGAESITKALNAVERRYFYGDEIDQNAMSSIVKSLANRRAETTPFAGLTGGDYFNAIYNQDFDRLRELDDYYVEGIRPLMALGSQFGIEAGPLIDAMMGRRQGESAAEFRRSLRYLTAVHAVTGTYLVRYDSLSKKCLRSDAVEYSITQTTDFVTTNSFGNEVSRRPGWTTQDSYTINANMAGQFPALFNTAKGTAQAKMFDLFLNDARVSALTSGTQELMATHDCASPEVERFEEGLVAYSDWLEQRVYGQ